MAQTNDTIDNTDTSTEDVTGLKKNNADLKRERDDAKRELRELRREKEDAEKQREREDKDIEALERRLTREHADALKTVTDERDALANDLKTVRIDNEIKTAITNGKVMPEWAELVESHLLRRVTYEDGVATIEGKSIADAAKAYLKTPTGMKTVLAPESTGSGSTGNSGAVANTWTKAPVSNSEWDAFDALEPAVRNGLADQWNMPALKV